MREGGYLQGLWLRVRNLGIKEKTKTKKKKMNEIISEGKRKWGVGQSVCMYVCAAGV